LDSGGLMRFSKKPQFEIRISTPKLAENNYIFLGNVENMVGFY
jgi:hypothetical protein